MHCLLVTSPAVPTAGICEDSNHERIITGKGKSSKFPIVLMLWKKEHRRAHYHYWAFVLRSDV